MKYKTRIASLILILVMAAALMLTAAGCRPRKETAEPAETSVLEEIKERGVLRVGTSGDYQPMSYLDPETNSYVGFDSELTKDLADRLGVDVEYVATSWPTLMDDTLAGKFDIAICGITITDARKEQALMSDAYLENGKTILCRTEDAGRMSALQRL